MFYMLIGLGLLCALAGAWTVMKSRRVQETKPESWWRSIMSDAKFAVFHQAVNEYFAGRNEKVEWSADKGMAVGQSGAQMGMGNLAQMCAKVDQQEWPRMIEEHFSRLALALVHAKPDSPPPWDSVRDKLTVRLMPVEAVAPAIRGDSVWRSDLEGVVTMLAIDYPETVSTVNRASAVEWGIPDEELFRVALANLEQRFGLGDPVKTELKNGTLHIFSAEHFFAASHALLMEQRPDLVGEYGAMVAIPTRHTFLVCPVNSFHIVHDIAMLLNVARKAEADGPGSITDQLYFFRYGKFSRLVSSLEGGQMKLTVPPEFQRVLEELQPEPEE